VATLHEASMARIEGVSTRALIFVKGLQSGRQLTGDGHGGWMTTPKSLARQVSWLGNPAAVLLLPLLVITSTSEGRSDPGSAQTNTPHRLDSNSDGVVSREEFLRYRLRLFFGREEDRPTWDARTRFAFTACDTNGDGVLNAAEMKERPDCGA
jgi:hypothetical protein